jgi:branched-chain amino acid transport system ATP-binding protein
MIADAAPPSAPYASPVVGAGAALLDVRDVGIAFGGLKAVQNFSLAIPRGRLHGLIGPNGAGKTTVFNLLTGVYRPQSGSITLDGRRLDGLKAFRVAQAGVSRTFQNIRLFGSLSVLDNVRLGGHLRTGPGLVPTILRTGKWSAREREMTDRARELLELFDLADRAHETARNLPYGGQRRLEMARALATSPKILLLDEPAAGLNTGEKAALADLIRSIRDRFSLTILLIEHDMTLVMDVCERITVLDYGVTIAEGAPREVCNNPKVREAYLGPADANDPLAVKDDADA